MATRSHKITFVIRDTGRSLGGDDSEVEVSSLDVGAWSAAAAEIKCRKFTLGDYVSEVLIDWAPLLKYYKRHLAVDKYVFGGGPKDVGRRIMKARYPRSSVKIAVRVRSEKKRKGHLSAEENRAASLTEVALYDAFIIMNLAVPGSCDFRRSELILNDKKWGDISLSNFLFENAFLDRNKVGWPSARLLPIGAVHNWFCAVRNGTSQLPQNAAERAIFALFYLAKEELNPGSVIWVFYALEGLLQTRVGESFGLMTKRLALLLELDEFGLRVLKKELRALYDMRSAIVHGGFKIAHPMNHDGLDKRVGEAFGDLIDSLVYGGALVLAVLQKMIESGWADLHFDEVLSGKSASQSP